VVVGELVGRSVLVGRKAGPSRLLEVDLFLVEKSLLAEQSATASTNVPDEVSARKPL
jgi:hypothetical protein